MPKGLGLPGHRIAFISYSLDRLDCTCGATMTAAWGYDWADHRRQLGLKVPGASQGVWVKQKVAGETK